MCSTDTSTCCHHLVISTDTPTPCVFDRHIVVLSSSSCDSVVSPTVWRQTSCEFDRHIGMPSSCEFDRHIGMLSSTCHHLVSLTDTSACHHLVSSTYTPACHPPTNIRQGLFGLPKSSFANGHSFGHGAIHMATHSMQRVTTPLNTDHGMGRTTKSHWDSHLYKESTLNHKLLHE